MKNVNNILKLLPRLIEQTEVRRIPGIGMNTGGVDKKLPFVFEASSISSLPQDAEASPS